MNIVNSLINKSLCSC